MDIRELAKLAKKKKTPQPSSNEDKIKRLQRSLERERQARRDAEKTIEESSRRLYLANLESEKLNLELESTLSELSDTVANLTSAEARRKATILTLITATVLFFGTEFFIEPILERQLTSTVQLILAKGCIFAILIPVEIIATKLIEKNITSVGELNEKLYNDLLISAYDDGVITGMERKLLHSSAKQLGISRSAAVRLEEPFREQFNTAEQPITQEETA